MSHRLARLLCFALCATLSALSAKEEATPVPTEITSKHFESRSTDTEMTTLFTGDVVVTGTNLRITCDRIEVVSMRLGEKSDVVAEKNRFKSLVATGSVAVAIILFCEITPKVIGARFPEQVALPASYPLTVLARLVCCQ